MKHIISNEAELLKFLREHWNRITDFGYIEIMRQSLEVYESEKPLTYEIAETRIKDFLSKYGNPNIEKPLWIEAEFE